MRCNTMNDEIVILNEREREGKNLALLLYVLYGLSYFTVITGLVALVIHFVKGEDVQGTFAASHLRWQLRTVLFSVLFLIIGGITAFIGIGVVILFLTPIWVVYRLVVGLLRLHENKPMYSFS